MRRLIIFLVLLLAIGGCVTPSEEKDENEISQQKAVRGIPPKVQDPAGWTKDIFAALEAVDRAATAENFCAVVAIIGQESGFQADPQVKNLPAIVRTGLLEKLDRLGPLAEPALKAILSGHAPDSEETFASRINSLKTERDLDRLFRDIAAAYREKLPGTFIISSAISKIMGRGGLSDLNPVTTAGSMQVKVSFARSLDSFEDLSEGGAREKLYTRAGGVLAGTARLLHYKTRYEDMGFRFADYNAGEYASRNAAFQEMLTQLTGDKLALDGDLLAYTGDGSQMREETKSLRAMLKFGEMRGLKPNRIRKDARDEKDIDFEKTEIWEEVRSAYEERFKKKPLYARMPNVSLSSPKLQGKRTTAWFAKNVKYRYNRCLGAL